MQPKQQQSFRKKMSDDQRAKNKTQAFYIVTFCLAHFLSPLLMWCGATLGAVIAMSVLFFLFDPSGLFDGKLIVDDSVIETIGCAVACIGAMLPLVSLWRRFVRKINDPRKVQKAQISIALSFAYYAVVLVAFAIAHSVNPTNLNIFYIPLIFMYVVVCPFAEFIVPMRAHHNPGTLGRLEAQFPDLIFCSVIFLIFMYLVIELTLVLATRKLNKTHSAKKEHDHAD